MGAEKLKDLALWDVGLVDNRPLPPALNENALRVSGAPVTSEAPPQYTLPFQYAAEPKTPTGALEISRRFADRRRGMRQPVRCSLGRNGRL